MKHLVSQPHAILSVENPKYQGRETISHEDALSLLNQAGQNNAIPMQGHYGAPERSILVSNPTDKQLDLVRKIAHSTGQESHIESNGKDHKMLYSNGPEAGKVVTGSGTSFHQTTPKDYYSVLPDGSTFTHNFDFDKSELDKSEFGKYHKQAKKFNKILPDERSIADHIESNSPSGIDRDLVEDYFKQNQAILKLTPINGLRFGNKEGNLKIPSKQKKYDKMDHSKAPPILVENGKVLDGHHRVRSAIKQGASHILAYHVINKSEDLNKDMMWSQGNYRLNRSELQKAREEAHMPPEQKRSVRQERQKFSQDPLESKITTKPGVSVAGIEARRADPRVKGGIAHGYMRTMSPAEHKERAKRYSVETYRKLKGQSKPSLPVNKSDNAHSPFKEDPWTEHKEKHSHLYDEKIDSREDDPKEHSHHFENEDLKKAVSNSPQQDAKITQEVMSGQRKDKPSSDVFMKTPYDGVPVKSVLYSSLTPAKMFRAYKNTPHRPESLFLKYAVHRIENRDKYAKATSQQKLVFDKNFLDLHQTGEASKKNRHITSDHLQDFMHHKGNKLISQLLNHQRKLHKLLLSDHSHSIMTGDDGIPRVALSRGLNAKEHLTDHSLASYADIPNPTFGSKVFRYKIPLNNVWYSYDAGPKSATSQNFGNENEWLVSPHDRMPAEEKDVHHLIQRERHSLAPLGRNVYTVNYIKSGKNIPIEAHAQLATDKDPDVRSAIAGNPNVHHSLHAQLANDENFNLRSAIAQNPNVHHSLHAQLANDENFNVRSAIAQNPNVHQSLHAQLANDEDQYVRSAIAKNPNVHHSLHAQLASDEDPGVRYAIAGNPNVHHSSHAQLANDGYQYVRSAIAKNPNVHHSVHAQLASDKDKSVRSAIAENPSYIKHQQEQKNKLAASEKQRNSLNKSDSDGPKPLPLPDFFHSHQGLIPKDHPDYSKAVAHIGKEYKNNKQESNRLYDRYIGGGGKYVKQPMEKGLKGDWEKEGYTFKNILGDRKKNPYSPLSTILAYDQSGEKAGHVHIYEHSNIPNAIVGVVKINPEHQRKGLATKMYSVAEKIHKKPIRPATKHSESAEAFWSQPNRPFGKSELFKGLKGDWKKEGYKISHEHYQDDGAGEGTAHVRVMAHDKSGNLAGNARFQVGDKGLNPVGTAVGPEHQRKGLANAMYAHAEKVTGKKAAPSDKRTDDSKALWNQPKRPFGKSDKVPGGLAEGKKPSEFPKLKLRQGKKVEMEHTSDPGIAQEIAMDHLTEDPNYYEKLKTIEKPKVKKMETGIIGTVMRSEPLMKPYVSEAQRRWAHTPAGVKALGGKESVKHWDKETKGKKLPEKVKKSNYGPRSMDLYSHSDNQRRKQSRTGENLNVGPNAAVRQAGPTKNQQAEAQARADKMKSRKNPVKVFSAQERKELASKKGLLAASEMAKTSTKKKQEAPDQRKLKPLLKPMAKAAAPKVNLNPEHGKTIANAYEDMKHDPNNLQVKASYGALINETKQQYQNLLNQGFKFTKVTDPSKYPYKNSKEMHHDIEHNKHLYYFPTSMGFGSEGEAPKDHPMLKPTEFKSHDGETMLANDILRQVHDVNGHFHGGKTTFSPKGEHQSYIHHKKMYSSAAQPALANELIMQNSWVNFGPHGEHNRKNPSQTIYAPQKAGLAPEWVWKGKWHGEA